MPIDWFTVVAQIVNFLILVWLLKRFLYRPILAAIDAREKRLALALADADAKMAEARQAQDDFQHKNEAFEQQRAALLSQATDEAKAERLRLLDAARQESDALRAKRQDALKIEQQNLSEALTRRTREEVFAIARKTLADLAGASLEERMAEVFMCRLRELDGAAKAGLAAALGTDEAVRVRSAFELPEAQRVAIQTALNETLNPSTSLRERPSTSPGASLEIRFETVPALVCGIELATNGQKVAWSIPDYLVSLEKATDELLKPPLYHPTQNQGHSAHEDGA